MKIVLNTVGGASGVAVAAAFWLFAGVQPAWAQGAPPAPQPPVLAPPPSAGPIVDMPLTDPTAIPTELGRETSIDTALSRSALAGATAIGGYGELTLTAPGNAPAVVDVRRLVLFVGHNFSERIRFYSELEVEHAVSSSTDQGEVEVEQAYLDGLLGPRLNLRGGLLIMPVGIVNVYHEPPSFNGVDRPEVDTFVIPSTWREPGLGLFGELAPGLRYQVYVVDGMNANGFSAEGFVREGHQEGQLAAARDFGAVARLDYAPRLGTVLGLSGYYATSGNTLRPTVGKVPVGLVELDARTVHGAFSARAEAAVGFIGDAAALNRALQAAAGPVSAQARGAYVEAAYDLLHLLAPQSDQVLTAFARYDYVDTQASVPAGFEALPALRRQVMTVGLVHRPIPQIGLKLDARRTFPGAGDGWNTLAAAITWMF